MALSPTVIYLLISGVATLIIWFIVACVYYSRKRKPEDTRGSNFRDVPRSQNFHTPVDPYHSGYNQTSDNQEPLTFNAIRQPFSIFARRDTGPVHPGTTSPLSSEATCQVHADTTSQLNGGAKGPVHPDTTSQLNSGAKGPVHPHTKFQPNSQETRPVHPDTTSQLNRQATGPAQSQIGRQAFEIAGGAQRADVEDRQPSLHGLWFK